MKNAHLLRYAHPSSLQRTHMYASFLRISRALHLDVFEQPAENYFFNNLLVLLPSHKAALDVEGGINLNLDDLAAALLDEAGAFNLLTHVETDC